MTQNDQINEVIGLYVRIEETISKTAKLVKSLDLLVPALSVLTSGSLWLLVSQILPSSTLWLGALISTVTTGITLYISAAGLNRRRSRALDLHKRTGRFLACVFGTTSKPWSMITGNYCTDAKTNDRNG
jgi:hypothetical protein